MGNSTQSGLLLCASVFLLGFLACKKDDPATTTPPPPPDVSFVEEFDTAANAFHRGWVPINNSSPKGSSVWTQGGGPVPFFAPFSSKGTYAGFLATDYLSTSGAANVISNWLVSPKILMKNGDKIIFYTRTWLLPNAFAAGDSTDYGNNLEVCLNRKNDGTFVGVATDPRSSSYSAAVDHGDFDLVLSITPPHYDASIDYFEYPWAHSNKSLYEPGSYPATWTRFEVNVDGFVKPQIGRFAFRYYTLDGGSNGNGSGVGIDSVAYVSKK